MKEAALTEKLLQNNKGHYNSCKDQHYPQMQLKLVF